MYNSLAFLCLGLRFTTQAVNIDMEGLPDTGPDISTWETSTAHPIASLVDINDMQIAAKNTLNPEDYAYYRAAALDEITYQANMLGWSKLRLKRFNFTDISNMNLKNDHHPRLQLYHAILHRPTAQAGRASDGAETKIVKAVYISNHGGRVVDLAPTAVEVLLDVHRNYPEVFGQLEIYADGGVRRASQVLALLAPGARAVGLGRPAMFANVYGQAGVAKMISILQAELTMEIQLIGQADVNKFRGNTTFVYTKQVELEYFGRPL